MERNVRKISLLTLALVFVLSTVLGLATILPRQNAVAEGSTTSMSVLIGDKSDNVTVTPASVKGDYTGLLVGPSSTTETWSAEINTVFTGDTSLTYLLPQDGNSIANGFTVKDADGNVVLTTVVTSVHYVTNATFIYVDNGETVTTPSTAWNSTLGDYYTYGTTTMTSWTSKWLYVSPSFGQVNTTVRSTTGVTIPDACGTLTFDYDEANQKLSVSTTTYAYSSINPEDTPNKFGTGGTLTVGSAIKDLSKGYTITMHNVNSYGSEEDGNLHEFTYSSPVLLRSINGVDTIATELGVDASVGTISYDGESEQDGQNVINLDYGYNLNNFTFNGSTVVKDIYNNNTITLKAGKTSFEYDANKEFTADEEITVTNNGVTKNYFVDVATNTKSINIDNVIKASTNTTITTQKTINGNSGVYVARADANTADRTAVINGTFNGSSSVSYYFGTRVEKAGTAFSIKNANGEVVCTTVNYYTNIWQAAYSKIYLYNPSTNVYTAPTATGYKVITAIEPSADGIAVLPVCTGAGTSVNNVNIDANSYTVKTLEATLWFDYDSTAKTLTVKVNTPQKISLVSDATVSVTNQRPEVVTVGVIENVDLSSGYTIEMHNQATQPDGTTAFANALDVLITKVNGRSVAGATIASSEVTGDIAYGNAKENNIDVVIGDELDKFTVNSVFKLKSLALNVTEEVTATVDTSVFGTKEVVVKDNSGLVSETFTVNVKGLLSSLDGIEMGYGASIRLGQQADNSDRGMRFRMNVSEDAQNTIASYIQKGIYTGVKYGMLIMPYSYIATYGAPTVETVFGDNAVYTWYGKSGAGETAIINLSGETLIDNVFYGAITSLIVNETTNNVIKEFVGVGYVELTLADGTKEYKVVSMYETYASEGVSETNNVRSVYEVAVLAYENDTKLDVEDKQWLLDNYLTPNGYVVEE